jgi:hypothetical protein
MKMKDPVGLEASLTFGYRSAYDGERGEREPPTGNDAADRLNSLQADLADPACTSIAVFGDAFPTQYWRKVHGPD